MTNRGALMMTGVLLAAIGCQRGGPATPINGAAAAASTADYRTLDQAAIEIIIADKTGSPVKLTPDGPNKYTGTRDIPNAPKPVPVTVTVEEKRIVVETRGGGLTSTQIITPRGVKRDDVR